VREAIDVGSDPL